MSHHLGYPPGGARPSTATNQRNRTGAKTVPTEDGSIRIEVHRVREGMVADSKVSKRQRACPLDRLDRRIVSGRLPFIHRQSDTMRSATSTTSPLLCKTVATSGISEAHRPANWCVERGRSSWPKLHQILQSLLQGHSWIPISQLRLLLDTPRSVGDYPALAELLVCPYVTRANRCANLSQGASSSGLFACPVMDSLKP